MTLFFCTTNTIMKICLLALVLAAFIGSGSAINTVNCNLRTGAGCNPSSPHFDLAFAGFSTSGSCRRTYRMRVRLFGSAKGFYCYFKTNTPARNRYTYTISHNRFNHDSSRTPWIQVEGSDGRVQPRSSSSSPYDSNYWYYKDIHSPRGESWVYYEFSRRKLSYWSTHLNHFFKVGHPNLFDPVRLDTYIGLNRAYETSSNRGNGLCQIYCEVLRSFGPAGARGSSGTRGAVARFSGAPGSSGGGGDIPSGPPPAP